MMMMRRRSNGDSTAQKPFMSNDRSTEQMVHWGINDAQYLR